MWEKLKLFIHHALNPHCADCAAEKAEQEARQDYCPKCEIYKGQAAQDKAHINQLINSILQKPAEAQEQSYQMPKEFAPRQKSWRIRQQELEAADRQQAEALKAAPKPDTITTDDLEPLYRVNLDANR